MNSWLDGSTTSVRMKGRQGIKLKNIPTVILSNYSLDQCYRKAYEKRDAGLEGLHDRLCEVELMGPMWEGCLERQGASPTNAPSPTHSSPMHKHAHQSPITEELEIDSMEEEGKAWIKEQEAKQAEQSPVY